MEVHILRTMDATKWQKNCTSAEIIVNTLSTEVRWGICSTKPIIRQYQRHFSCRLSIVRVLVSLPGKRAGTLFPTGVWDFSLYQREQTGFGAHPPSDSVISWEFSRPGRAAEAWGLTTHPQPSSEVKNKWSYTPLPSLWLHGIQRGNYAFTINLDFSRNTADLAALLP